MEECNLRYFNSNNAKTKIKNLKRSSIEYQQKIIRSEEYDFLKQKLIADKEKNDKND